MNTNNDISIAKQIAKEVEKLGGTCYFVGGYVRDKLMGKCGKDIDIEVHGISPELLESVLDKIGTRKEMGKSFGVYSLCGCGIDIAMPRKEECTGRGHRDFRVEVDPHLGTEKAAVRRDFTINSIMENILTGEIVDHFGGCADIEKKIIRHINDSSFVEDPLRVLRGAQFAARFAFSVAPETEKLCKKMELVHLASERVFEEMKKALLKAEKPSVFFETLNEMNALDVWFKELLALKGIKQNENYHQEGDAWNHTMMVIDEAAKMREDAEYPLWLMIAALCHDFGKAVTTKEIDGIVRAFGHETEGLFLVRSFLKRVTADKKLINYVLNMTLLHMRPNMLVAQKSKIKATNRLFDEAVSPRDLIKIAMADNLGKIPRGATEETEKFLIERLSVYEEYMARDYVSGKDLLEMGIPQGEKFTEILEFSHKLRLSGVKKEDVIKQIKKEYKKEV